MHPDLQLGLFSWNIATYAGLPLAAFLLDLLFGDPKWLPHPVCGIGKLLQWLEKPARRLGNETLGGVLAVLVLCALVGGVCEVLVSFLGGWSIFIAVYLSWSGLALGSLLRECRKALELVESGDLEAGRRAVGMLVSRNTADMDQAQLCRSLGESLSENFNDGFVAPFFWLVFFGPVGLWIYKAVSTVDSMWGYKTPRWRKLGCFGARLDDVLAYVPARLSALFLLLVELVKAEDKPGIVSFAEVRRQAARMESPNAGWPMAMSAWLVWASMGGPTPYNGKIVDKPLLGPAGVPWTPSHVRRLLQLVATAGVVGFLILWGAGYAGHRLFG